MLGSCPVRARPEKVRATSASGAVAAPWTRRAVSAEILGAMAQVHPARHLLRAKDFIDTHYRESIHVATVAGAAHQSSAHFTRQFRATFGETPHQYLLTRRMERAAALLRNTDYSVARVCVSVGLSSVGSFTSAFRRTFDETPLQYRARNPSPFAQAVIPTCVFEAISRPRSSRIREDSARLGT